MNDNTRWTRSKESHRTTDSPTGNRSPVENNNRNKKGMRKPLTRPHETEEEAIIRRFHDAQRMAKFRAKKRKALEEARVMEASKLSEEIAMITELRRRNVVFEITPIPQYQNTPPKANETLKKEISLATITPVTIYNNNNGPSKYSQLLSVIEELGRDVKLSYAGSKTSAERLKSGIAQARMLVRDCLLETEINSRQ